MSLHVQGASGPATEHLVALQTSYASPPGSGDHTADQAGTGFSLESTGRSHDVEIQASRRVGAVVALTIGTPAYVTLASVFCVPATSNISVNIVGDLPGPGATALAGVFRTQ